MNARAVLLAGMITTTSLHATGTTATTRSTAVAHCHTRLSAEGVVLPDPTCTPGVTNPAVTQATIRTTICVPGWTATIRPPATFTSRLKRQQIVEYGYTDTNPRHYEEDHLISLELGGDPVDPKNLWPEFGRTPNPKDGVENRLRKAVCDGRIPLVYAQQFIANDWGQRLPT